MRPVSIQAASARRPLGAQLRAARLRQGLTIQQVAEATSLTRGFISRVERDETSPSVATLLAICQTLSTEIGSLFGEPDLHRLPLDQAPRINLGGTGTLDRLLTPRSLARVQVLRSSIAPGGDGGAELYAVNAAVEVLHVLRGTVRVTFAADVIDLGPGDTLTFSGKDPHTWSNRSAEPAELLWVLSPAPWSGTH